MAVDSSDQRPPGIKRDVIAGDPDAFTITPTGAVYSNPVLTLYRGGVVYAAVTPTVGVVGGGVSVQMSAADSTAIKAVNARSQVEIIGNLRVTVDGGGSYSVEAIRWIVWPPGTPGLSATSEAVEQSVEVGETNITQTVVFGGVSPAALTAAFAAHVALPDPHPGYLTPAEGAAAFDASGAASSALAAAVALVDDLSGVTNPAAARANLGLGYKLLAAEPDLLIAGVIVRDANGAATSAPVVWPDGTVGTYTATTVSVAFPGAVDAYTITYGSPLIRTYTQPAVTRDGNGAVTVRPAITVTEA